jgi:hypothetical protein
LLEQLPMQDANVRMIQAGDSPGFLLKALA